jgi:hypothetical protein
MRVKTNVKAGEGCWQALDTVEKKFSDFTNCCQNDPDCLK